SGLGDWCVVIGKGGKWGGTYTFVAGSRPKTSSARKITTKMKNRMRAISALAADMPPKPKIAATTEIGKNMRAHLSNVIKRSFRQRRQGGYQLRYSRLVPMHGADAATQRLALQRKPPLNGQRPMPSEYRLGRACGCSRYEA